MLKTFSIFFLVLVLSSLACIQPAALSSSSPTPTETLTKPAPTASQAPLPTATERAHCKVIAQEALNLRDGPGLSFVVIGWLSPGEQLTLTNTPAQGSWIQITTESNLMGWINSNYCKIGE
jgi:uncharacterized protein YgiM (DUF1202 family)